MTDTREGGLRGQLRRGWAAAAAGAVGVPVVVLAVVRLRPRLDVAWESHPAHFWLVLVASMLALSLGYGVSVAARRRQDARLLLVSLAFIAGAGFLGLHALATPGVLLGPNAGFELATPVGLVLGGVLVALSAVEFTPRTSHLLVARAPLLLGALTALIVLWGILSLAEVPPLHGPVPPEALQGWQVGFALAGVLGYGAGAVGYLRLFTRRRAPLAFVLAVALALLGEAILVILFAVNWRVSWWEWHVLMLAAFGLIAWAAHREWHEERFSALYLEHTLAGARDVSILFADLQGYTTFSEGSSPADVARMLNSYYARLVPLLEEAGGQVHQLIGDAIMVVFNKDGETPDHARSAARAGLLLQKAADEIRRDNPSWPRFRVGVNSGEVATGVLGGDRGHRKHDVIGDSVNLAARLESQAAVGTVVVGEGTHDRLPPGAVVERLPPMQVKGKQEAVTAYVLHALD